MKQIIFRTNDSMVATILRWAIAIVFLPHGLQKTLGLFKGDGFTATMQYFTEHLNLPWIVGFSVILVELLGPIFFIIGFASRFWAVAFIGLMIGIMVTDHLQNGFFMNWFGTQEGEGCQFDILTIGIAIAIALEGSGKFSIDKLIYNGTKISK